METIFDEVADKIKAINVGAIFVNSVDNKIKEDIWHNVTDRLSDGVDVEYAKLQTDTAKKQNSKTYSNRTKSIKQAKGQPIDRVTLRDTGEFWESIHTEVTPEYIEIVGEMDKPDGNIYENFKDSYSSEKHFDTMILNIDYNERTQIGNEIAQNMIKQISNELQKL